MPGQLEKNMQKALKNKVFVNKNDDCYECFDIMNKNNIEFVQVKDNNKVIGFLSKQRNRNGPRDS